MKLFNTSDDIKGLIQEKWNETGLAQIGINLKILSTTKSKLILNVQRANATTHFMTNKDVVLTVYEEAFEKLPDEYKTKLCIGALSNVSYDTEKDKLIVENDIAKEIFRMRKKYPDYVDILEASSIVIAQIAEEEKERKEMEREAKKNKKNKN